MAHYKGKLKSNEVANFSLGGRFITLIQTPSKSDINILDNFNREFFATTGNFSGFRFENTKLKEGTLQLNIKNLGTKEEDYNIFVSDTITLDVPAKVDNFVTVNAGASIGIDPAENTVKIDNNNNVIKLSDNTVKIDPSNNIAKNDELPTIINNPHYWCNLLPDHLYNADKLKDNEIPFSYRSADIFLVDSHKIIEDNTATIYYIRVAIKSRADGEEDREKTANLYRNKNLLSSKTILLSNQKTQDLNITLINFENAMPLLNNEIFLLNSDSISISYTKVLDDISYAPFYAIIPK